MPAVVRGIWKGSGGRVGLEESGGDRATRVRGRREPRNGGNAGPCPSGRGVVGKRANARARGCFVGVSRRGIRVLDRLVLYRRASARLGWRWNPTQPSYRFRLVLLLLLSLPIALFFSDPPLG